MRIATDDRFQLTYCTNVHPGGDWNEVFTNLEKFVPPLKARFAPDRPFGIGLRLSGLDSYDLVQGDELEHFAGYLKKNGLYVSTMNGFPYGQFHQTIVKEYVHAPDWREDERVAYTLRLIKILARVLPEGMDGGISTSPLSYKGWVSADDTAAWELQTRNVLKIADKLIKLKNETGQLIHLDIEPEPDGLLGDCAELIAYFEEWLLPLGVPKIAADFGISEADARDRLLDHIRVCFDTCHVAMGYENPAELLDRFDELGIKIGKIQVSSAIRVLFEGRDRDALSKALRPFDESTYLHQVVQRNADGSLSRYRDLYEALPAIDAQEAEEWRIHFHVPIFIDDYRTFGSTQDMIVRVLDLVKERYFTDQLEIETYTWDVLPADMKQDLPSSIAREYEWVLNAFA
ncbi:metabolite traffic protein EboE [soil metagenome]